jgi:hypothetical protein
MRQSWKLTLLSILGLGLSANSSHASITYDWVPDASTSVFTSGSLTVAGGSVTSLTFTDGSEGTWVFNQGLGIGSYTPLGPITTFSDNDVALLGLLSGPSTAGINEALIFNVPGIVTPTDEQNVNDTQNIGGDWVPVAVPEPATLVAGALLLLPFGAVTLGMVRRNHAA